MRRRLYIPEEVKSRIQSHLDTAIRAAVAGYESASEDEDTLTGHLGATLQVRLQRVVVPRPSEIPGEWKWSIRYYKFRGRGPAAPERFLGADGIFELALEIGGRTERKSLLFQAKIGARGGQRLLEQAIKLSTWREAAFVVVYSPSGFQAFSLDDAIMQRGDLSTAGVGVPPKPVFGHRLPGLSCR